MDKMRAEFEAWWAAEREPLMLPAYVKDDDWATWQAARQPERGVCGRATDWCSHRRVWHCLCLDLHRSVRDMSEFNEKAPTPPDTATDAGRVVACVDDEFTTEAMLRLHAHLCGEGKPILADCLLGLAKQRDRLASDLDAVSAERDEWKGGYESMKYIADSQLGEIAAKEQECERLREALVEVQAARYREQGMKVEQSYIHAKCDVDRERIRFAREALATGGRHD